MHLQVKSIKKEAPFTLSILFEKPVAFQFYPSQFIDVAVNIKNPDNSRIYSFSSSPTEEFLMITLREGFSPHKKKLQNLKPGDLVTISHPNGTYTLDESSPAVMLAGGVGIASHRSMIKFALDSKLKTPITLIYSNPDENFIFKQELDLWQKQYPKLTIHYINTTKNGRLTKDKLESLYPKYQILDTIYYLAGPPSFVEDMEKILTQLQVDRVNIRLDSFDGY
jgi:ferredoxin-NADP reductase